MKIFTIIRHAVVLGLFVYLFLEVSGDASEPWEQYGLGISTIWLLVESTIIIFKND